MLNKDAFDSAYFNSFEYRETYSSGDDEIFQKYVRRVSTERFQKILTTARSLLKANFDQFYFMAFDFLAKPMKDYLSGKLEISEAFDWEMFGRAFETIAERFKESVSVKGENCFNEAKGFGMLCFKCAGNKSRLKRLFETLSIVDTGRLRKSHLLENPDPFPIIEEPEILDYRPAGQSEKKQDWEEDWGTRSSRNNSKEWWVLDSDENEIIL